MKKIRQSKNLTKSVNKGISNKVSEFKTRNNFYKRYIF